MRAKGTWTVQSFFTCFLINAIMLGVFYYLAMQILHGLHQWVDPFLTSTPQPLPDDLKPAFTNLKDFLNEAQAYLIPAIFGIGGAFTLILWLFVLLGGRGLVNRAKREVVVAKPAAADEKKAKAAEKKPRVEAPPKAEPAQPSPQTAVQVLSILQREGRFIDFLQEDLSLYEDSQIGAAVRSIHEGCKGGLSQYVELKPIYDESEGSEVTVPPGFDSRSIRLTGNVAGNPPFKGIIRHRGWRVAKIELPQPASEQKKDWVLAPAEVEIGE